MGLFGWLKRRNHGGGDTRLADWRRAWLQAVGEPSAAGVTRLTQSLNALGLPDEDVEVEREMLDGLQQLIALRDAVSSGGLPVITTGHRVVARDVCHFTAPASMPDDPAQPSGRLIVTDTRAIFVGGARATVVPWHAIVETALDARDLVLVKHDRDTLYRFRCNSFADALCGEFLARQLAAHRRGRSQ
jgi:hypothetical protein